MDLSPDQIRLIVQTLIILILSIAVHEFGHAYVAHRLGDGLPKSQGRVTLNPAAHADPLGTLLFPVVALIATKGASIGFGWGKPVQINPVAFTRRVSMRRGHMMVALAGPAMNVVFALVIALVHLALVSTGVIEQYTGLSFAIQSAVLINFVLCFFNLVPVAPLDGGAVLENLLPARWQRTYEKVAVYAPFMLLALILIPQFRVVFIGPAYWVHTQLYTLLGLA